MKPLDARDRGSTLGAIDENGAAFVLLIREYTTEEDTQHVGPVVHHRRVSGCSLVCTKKTLKGRSIETNILYMK